jgi:hypothetical protein
MANVWIQTFLSGSGSYFADSSDSVLIVQKQNLSSIKIVILRFFQIIYCFVPFPLLMFLFINYGTFWSGTTHSVRMEEQLAFSDWINTNLGHDEDLQ